MTCNITLSSSKTQVQHLERLRLQVRNLGYHISPSPPYYLSQAPLHTEPFLKGLKPACSLVTYRPEAEQMDPQGHDPNIKVIFNTLFSFLWATVSGLWSVEKLQGKLK